MIDDDGLETGRGRAAAAAVQLLVGRAETLATVESLTGGLLAATIVDIAGVSSVYRGGLVVYATPLKASLAGVPEDLLARSIRMSRSPSPTGAGSGAAPTGACRPPGWPGRNRRADIRSAPCIWPPPARPGRSCAGWTSAADGWPSAPEPSPRPCGC
jgi:hypothetical protein